MKQSKCPYKCIYLCSDIGYCIRPELGGRGQKLKINENNDFIKSCEYSNSTIIQKKKENQFNNSFCNKQCAYLNSGYGICIRHELGNKGVLLKRSGDNFVKICNMQNSISSKNKYHSKKVTHNGITYDSEKEYHRHLELLQLEKAGIIKDLKYHVRFPLIDKNENGREIAYEADFVYFENGEKIVEDVKTEPTKTRLYALKKRLMLEKYGIKIFEYI